MPRPQKKKESSRARSRSTAGASGSRKRLSPELRRTQIMDAAAGLIVAQGFLPLPVEQLAQVAGASKALIYAYFPTQYDLFNTMLQRELANLSSSGLETALRVKDLDQAALLCAMLYFEHIAKSGPLLHILMTDRYMSGQIDTALTRVLDVMLDGWVRLAKRTLPLSKKEILAAIEMMAAIPEESGVLAYQQQLDPAVARQLCHSLVLSSLEALRSPDTASAVGSDDPA
jgi:AcrR family transcriptional regulator